MTKITNDKDKVKTMNDKLKLRNRWMDISKHGYPPKSTDDYYGERYSVPVLAGNSNTGQVSKIAYIYDYDYNEWVEYALNYDDDIQHVTHWCLWPKCKLVCLDQNKIDKDKQ